jgi:hypothetical protein
MSLAQIVIDNDFVTGGHKLGNNDAANISCTTGD